MHPPQLARLMTDLDQERRLAHGGVDLIALHRAVQRRSKNAGFPAGVRESLQPFICFLCHYFY
jgi:hypothetical protein